MLTGDDVFSETFDCGDCEVDAVFTISTTDFTQIGDHSGWGGWNPVFNRITRKCPHCGEETEFAMDTEHTRWGDLLVINSNPD